MNATTLILIFLGVIISVILIIGVQLILPFPYGLVVGIITPIVIFVLIKKNTKSKPQNDDIQKLKDRVEELEKDKEKNSENS